MNIAPELLKNLLSYDPETGQLVWRERPREMFTSGYHGGETSWKTWNTKHAGRPAAELDGRGYLRLGVWGQRVLAHRAAWAIVHGVWPDGEIDHINGDKADNRLSNLREVDRRANAMNCAVRSDSSTGVTGVSYAKRDGKYIAHIRANSRTKVIGRYRCLTAAVIARKAAERRYGYHPNHGRATE